MLRIEHRRKPRPIGLVDDFVVYGEPTDYIAFAERVGTCLAAGSKATLNTASRIRIEIILDSNADALFTALQNQDDDYPTLDDWEQRDILRVRGSVRVLEALRAFLVDLSGRGDGYSYLSEYSEDPIYHAHSPEWRLHVETGARDVRQKAPVVH